LYAYRSKKIIKNKATKKCVHMYVNAKMITIETIPGTGGEGINESGGGVNSSMIYLIHSTNLCKYHSVPPSSTTIREK
jgi:hypothetical protein